MEQKYNRWIYYIRPRTRRYNLWHGAARWRENRRRSLAWLLRTGRITGIVLANNEADEDEDESDYSLPSDVQEHLDNRD